MMRSLACTAALLLTAFAASASGVAAGLVCEAEGCIARRLLGCPLIDACWFDHRQLS